MSRPTLSVAIIAGHEADNLRALVPLLGFADEVVVVCGESGPTADAASSLGARVELRPFDTFATQRNHALDLCRGEWVLFIDADERPTPGLVDELRRTLPRSRAAGYRVPIRSRIFGRTFRFSGTQDDRPVRLVRRGSGRWQGAVHETLVCQGRVDRLAGHLTHVTLPDLGAFLSKMHRYTTLEARARVARGEPPRRHEAWLTPLMETLRRLLWKHGWLDGPEGWAFCLLSGLSQWTLAMTHRRLWREQATPAPRPASQASAPQHPVAPKRAPGRVRSLAARVTGRPAVAVRENPRYVPIET